MMKHMLIILVCVIVLVPCCAYGSSDENSIYYNKVSQGHRGWNDHSKQSDSVKVINILIDRMDKSHVYAKDGRVFALTKMTEIINNSNPEARVQIGELIYKDGNLIALVIK